MLTLVRVTHPTKMRPKGRGIEPVEIKYNQYITSNPNGLGSNLFYSKSWERSPIVAARLDIASVDVGSSIGHTLPADKRQRARRGLHGQGDQGCVRQLRISKSEVLLAGIDFQTLDICDNQYVARRLWINRSNV